MNDVHLTEREIEEVRRIQRGLKCTWERAYEIWNEDTDRFDIGE
jgi:DNA-binding CsgD family transcriptional regulator